MNGEPINGIPMALDPGPSVWPMASSWIQRAGNPLAASAVKPGLPLPSAPVSRGVGRPRSFADTISHLGVILSADPASPGAVGHQHITLRSKSAADLSSCCSRPIVSRRTPGIYRAHKVFSRTTHRGSRQKNGISKTRDVAVPLCSLIVPPSHAPSHMMRGMQKVPMKPYRLCLMEGG